LLAVLYCLQGNISKALEACQRSLELNPEHPLAMELLGQLR